MKEKPSKKNDASAANDESDKLDENGYRDIPTVGVSEFYYFLKFSRNINFKLS